MFNNPEYECITLVEVKNEILQTTKFKDKYDWRTSYKNKLKTVGMTKYNTKDFQLTEKTVATMLNNCVKNNASGHIFDLSSVDRKIASLAVTDQYNIATEDKSLKQFVYQEFEIEGFSALEVLNHWIRAGKLVIDERMIEFISDWKKLEEPEQPLNAIREFETLTKRKYTGS